MKTGKSRLLTALWVGLSTLTVQSATTVSQFGITWTFDKDYPTGQYANGDYWVVGPVTIVGITPGSSVDSSGRTKNGSQLNPKINSLEGYDSASGDMKYDESMNAGRPGGGDLSPDNPLKISTGSLVSTISIDKIQPRPQLKTAAILTVVEAAPSEGAFRPPPVGSDKTSYWNKTNLNYSILKSLSASGMPSLSIVEKHFQKPWIEQNPNWTTRTIHPADNQPAYGRDMAHTLAEGLLSLHLDYSNQEKETLFIRLVQYGIDIYGSAKAGAVWVGYGGHNQGRKMPLILAGLALNDKNILAYGDAAEHFIFQEDHQTWYITQKDVGRTLYTADKRPREQYIDADVGIAEWGEQHSKSPNRDARNWDAPYRDNVYSSCMGHALAAHLTSGAVELWNWPAFFDYMDRAFAIEGKNASANNQAIQPYIANMWNTYRYKFSVPKQKPE